jgi:tetratricopeptide (TPR) repeat protein
MRRAMRLRICLTLTLTLAMAAPAHGMGQTAGALDQQRQTALALEQQGKNVEAEAAWRSYSNTHPSNPEPYAHLGLLEARQEHYKEAVPLYHKALALNPKMPGLRLNLGLALFKGGELKQAILEFKPLIKSQPPGSPEAQRLNTLMGMAYYGLGEYAAAVPYLKQTAAHDAQDLPLRLDLAHSCLWAKQYQCVLDTYHEILALNAESAEADMLAGEAMDEMKDPSGAIQQFRAAVKVNPHEPGVHFGLGYLLWTQTQYPEAASEFQTELDNNPNHVQALTYLGDAEMHLKHPELARPLLENALRIDAGQELAHLDLGILLADAGSRDDALRELSVAAKLDPGDVNVHWRLGRLYRAMGKKDEANAEFGKAKSITSSADNALINKVSNGHAAPGQTQHPVPAPADK